jgi:hypothetical protein
MNHLKLRQNTNSYNISQIALIKHSYLSLYLPINQQIETFNKTKEGSL